jgi:hypothetical protein
VALQGTSTDTFSLSLSKSRQRREKQKLKAKIWRHVQNQMFCFSMILLSSHRF